jgi:protein-S-isoprenylcysteine O-methyltransferase Ste14
MGLAGTSYLALLSLSHELTARCITPPVPFSLSGVEPDSILPLLSAKLFPFSVFIAPILLRVHLLLLVATFIWPTWFQGTCLQEQVVWTPRRAQALTLIIFFGSLRLASFSSLGTDFKFALTRPSKLRTDGLYRYIQHPSYTGLFGVILGQYLYWFDRSGPLGCMSKNDSYELLLWVSAVLLVLVGLAVRVHEEETLLKRTFGREWEAWHTKTARFIPFLF